MSLLLQEDLISKCFFFIKVNVRISLKKCKLQPQQFLTVVVPNLRNIFESGGILRATMCPNMPLFLGTRY